jgi:hypothetical protein
MKAFKKRVAIFLEVLFWAQASAQVSPPPEWDISIPGPLCDGTRAEPSPPQKPIDFKILSSFTKRVHVTEAPEMHDLPPVEGTINVTVQRVEDPGLPDPPSPPPLPATTPDDPEVVQRINELREQHRGTDLVFLSATVYNHTCTLLQIYPNGKMEGEISVWTNIDFNHFSGFSTYQVKEADKTVSDYGVLMGIGNCDTPRSSEWFARQFSDADRKTIAALPDIAVSGPSYSVIGGDTQGEAMKILTQLHDLYRKEGVRLEAAYHAREKAYAERKAYLLANPPVPKDVTIQVWKRDFPLSQSKPGPVR